MSETFLFDSVIFLAAAVLMVPIFKRFGLGSVLGYLAAGAIIGPWGLEYVEEPEAVLHFAELGVVMLLFIIGLELKPARLWTMRRSVFGLGAAQVIGTFVVLTSAASAFGYGLVPAMVAGFALALSSTAFALQVMAERGELSAQSGRAGFSILLFQDLAVIPVLALVPLFGPVEVDGESNLALSIALVVAAIGGIVIGGRHALRPLFRLIAVTRANEIFTAAALLVVLGVAVLMNAAGLSMALGAFIAGVLLADCEYRHQIAADIEPFRGLLLGLFFLSVGMTVDFGLLWKDLGLIVGAVVLLVSLKTLTIWLVARAFAYKRSDSLKVGLTLSQGGEFAFVLMGVAVTATLIDGELKDQIIAVITLSMAVTPLLLKLFDLSQSDVLQVPEGAMEKLDGSENAPVIIAGFGRVGQIVGRILEQENIPFTSLDPSPDQIDLSARYGHKTYYGDATRADVLRAAGADQAKILVIAVDDPVTSVRVVETVKRHFPHLKVYARARNRPHALDLIEGAVDSAVRETLECGLQLGNETLQALGRDVGDATQSVETFRTADYERLQEQQQARTNKK